MVSTTSGTTSFYLDVDDIIEEAAAPFKIEDSMTGNMQAKFRRTLNLLLIEMQNKKVPLHKIATTSVPVISGTSAYTLDSSINDVLEVTLKTTSTAVEIPLNRMGRREFHTLAVKSQQGQPTSYSTDRKSSGTVMTLWPVPNASSTWTLELLSLKKVEDVTASYQRIDLPYRFYPLLVSWLRYKIALTIPEAAPLVQGLKMDFDIIYQDTMEEDTERVDFVVRPGGISGR